MKILIGAFGTHGDVQPMAALAQALEAKGHAVRFAVSPSSLAFAKGLALDAFPVGLDYEEVSRRTATGNLLQVLSTVPLVRDEVGAQLAALRGPAAEADVLIGASVSATGQMLSEALRKPYVFFGLCPNLLPSSRHPMPGVSRLGLPGWLNRLSWRVSDAMWRIALLDATNAARAELGLAPVKDVWSQLFGQHPVIATDPALAEVPDDARPLAAQPGALFLTERLKLSPAVEAFLSKGAPPVYLGFGSMSDPDPRETTARLVAAARLAGARALVSRGWAGLAGDAAEDVLVIGPEPHQQLFPRCAAVVHHGGAGTTHAAARAGVPQVLMPQILDQHYWAHHVTKRGIGFTAHRHARSPGPLAEALKRCLTDDEVRAAAKALGASMRPDAAARAVELIEQVAAQSRSSGP